MLFGCSHLALYFEYPTRYIHIITIMAPSKIVFLLALVSSVSAFAPAVQNKFNTQLFQEKPDWEKAAELGWSVGGEDYTRNVTPQQNEDPRKTIPQGESFEEYMRKRQQMGQ